MKVRETKGFTLIELIMVIVILGILAAVAIPKFVDLSSNAAKSACEGVRGGVASAASIYYANEAAHGKTAVFPDMTNLNAALQNDLNTACPGGNGGQIQYDAVHGTANCTNTLHT